MPISLEAGPVFAKGMDSFQDKIIPFFVFVVVITVIGFCQIFCIGLKIERVSSILIADKFFRFFNCVDFVRLVQKLVICIRTRSQ